MQHGHRLRIQGLRAAQGIAPGSWGDDAQPGRPPRSRIVSVAAGETLRYHRGMDQDDAPRPVPPGWLEAMDESDAQLAAGQTVPGEPLLDELRRTAERLEAKLANEGEATPGTDASGGGA